MALVDCVECGKKISDAAQACPHCGMPRAQETPDQSDAVEAKSAEGRRRTPVVLKLVGWALFIFFFIKFCVPSPETTEEIAAREAKAAEDRRKGFHCLSGWDGSHPKFKREVVDRLRDPDSFEHIETRVTPVNDGKHTIVMEYRAKNGFGGMVVGAAAGSYANNDCDDVTLLVSE